MAATIFNTATEYIANSITFVRGSVSDIVSVGIYVNTNPNVIPTYSQFTTVTLVNGNIIPLPSLAVAGEVDIVTKVGPGGGAVTAGDLNLASGDYQVWTLVTTASEQIISKIDTLTIT